MIYSLRHFVDREPQLAAFEARLKGREKRPVLIFHGPKDMGKTTILYRLRAFCRDFKTTCALVDLEVLNEVEAIVECLGESFGDEFLDAMQEATQELERDLPRELGLGRTLDGVGGSPLLAAQPVSAGQITGQFGDVSDSDIIVGERNMMIKKLILVMSPEDAARYEKKKRTHHLIETLRAVLARRMAQELVVLLFDNCDRATAVVLEWLCDELLEPLLDCSLPNSANLAIILGGECKGGAWLQDLVHQGAVVASYELGNLPPEAVRKYWIEIRGLDESTLDADFCTRGAPPALMVRWADYKAGI